MGAAMGGSITSTMFETRGNQRAAETQADTAAAQSNLNQYVYQQNRADLAPYRAIGTQALNQLAALYGFQQFTGGTDLTGFTPAITVREEEHDLLSEGLSSGLTPGTRVDFNPNALNAGPSGGVSGQGGAGGGSGQPDYSNFFASPDYQFRMSEGIKAQDRSASARGNLFSGAQGKAITEFGQGLASTEFGNYFNRLAALAGIGQSATTTSGQFGQQYAANTGNALNNFGNQRASIYQNQGQVWGNTAQNIGNDIEYRNYLNRQRNQNSGQNSNQDFYDDQVARNTVASNPTLSWSDVRLKQNMEPIGKVGPLTLYRWEWIEPMRGAPGCERNVGFEAGEVAEHYPHCVVDISGLRAVNYGALMAQLRAEDKTCLN